MELRFLNVFKWIVIAAVTVVVLLESLTYFHDTGLYVLRSTYGSVGNASRMLLMASRIATSTATFKTKFIFTEFNFTLWPHLVDYENNSRVVNVGIACAITSASSNKDTPFNQVFANFLPTFCKAADRELGRKKVMYHFFFAYDYTDKYFAQEIKVQAFQTRFINTTKDQCADHQPISVTLLSCQHSGNPAWAQNDAALEAYLHDMDYIYRINDDTNFVTANWTNRFATQLASHHPPNVGSVGPDEQLSGSPNLRYDFTHRTHVEIFGFHYPRSLKDWYADDWIGKVYSPSRTLKMWDVKVKHTETFGVRYHVKTNDNDLRDVLSWTMVWVQRYVDLIERKVDNVDKTKLISMVVDTRNLSHVYGMIRNAQLMKALYSDWKVRMYIPNQKLVPDTSFNEQHRQTLARLGVEILEANVRTTLYVAPCLWHLFALDEVTWTHVMFRNTYYRVSEREMTAVEDWLSSKTDVHYLVDQKDAPSRITSGLWAVKLHFLRQQFIENESIRNLTKQFIYTTAKSYNNTEDLRVEDEQFLQQLSSQFKNVLTLCHDSSSKNVTGGCRSFPSVPLVTYGESKYCGQEFGFRGRDHVGYF